MSLDIIYLLVLLDITFESCNGRTVVSKRVVQTIGFGPNHAGHRVPAANPHINHNGAHGSHNHINTLHRVSHRFGPVVHQHVVSSGSRSTHNSLSSVSGNLPDDSHTNRVSGTNSLSPGDTAGGAFSNLPPGTRVYTSKKYHVRNPKQPMEITRTIIGPDGRKTVHKHTTHQSSEPKTFAKSWWSQTVPIKFNTSDNNINISPNIPGGTTIRKRVWSGTFPMFTTNSSDVGFTASDFFANLPPGAKVRVEGGSSVLQHSGNRINYNVFGLNDHQEDFRKVGKPKKKDRHLPQPGKPAKAYTGGSGNTINEDEKFILLEDHNRARRDTSPSAANMKKLIWDVELEHAAQRYAKQCIWTHDKQRSNHGPYNYIGQNMHVRRGARHVLGATSNWEAEKDNYNMHTGQCVPGKMCGHYTQMVWADTETVGCAMWKCAHIQNLGWRDAYLIVCNYGPGGNVYGQKPYSIGQRCTKCDSEHPTCVNGLCI